MKYKNAFKTQEGKEEVLKQYDMLLEALTIPHERFYVNTCHGSTFCRLTMRYSYLMEKKI